MLLLDGQARVNAVAFAPDGATLAAACQDERVRAWDLATGRERSWSHGLHNPAQSVAVSPDGRWLASGSRNGQVVVRDLISGRVEATPTFRTRPGQRGWSSVIDDLAFSPDGRYLAAFRGPSLGCWQTTNWDFPPGWRPPWFEMFNASPRRLAFSADSWLLATTGGVGGAAVTLVRFVHARTGQVDDDMIGGFPADGMPHVRDLPCDVDFAPDGRMVAAACRRSVCVWDASFTLPDGGPSPVRQRERYDQPLFRSPSRKTVHAAAFTPDGRFLAAAGAEGVVRFWDASTWREAVAFDWDIGPLTCLAIAPDGLRAAAGSKDGHIVVWDVDL